MSYNCLDNVFFVFGEISYVPGKKITVDKCLKLN